MCPSWACRGADMVAAEVRTIARSQQDVSGHKYIPRAGPTVASIDIKGGAGASVTSTALQPKGAALSGAFGSVYFTRT